MSFLENPNHSEIENRKKEKIRKNREYEETYMKNIDFHHFVKHLHNLGKIGQQGANIWPTFGKVCHIFGETIANPWEFC